MGMKKFVIALILVAGVTGIAYAAFDSSGSKKQKMKVEKKAEKKKECKRSCIFSIWCSKPSDPQKASLFTDKGLDYWWRYSLF